MPSGVVDRNIVDNTQQECWARQQFTAALDEFIDQAEKMIGTDQHNSFPQGAPQEAA